MLEPEEEIVAVIYHETDGSWYPHSILTRKPRRKRVADLPQAQHPRLPGWYQEDYDAAYSKADDTVYVHKSGGGGDRNEVHVLPYAEPDAMPGRIWLHPEAHLVTYRDDATVPIDRSELAAMGYTLLDALPDDPFDGTEEGDTTWCDACEDNVEDDDTFVCAVCCNRGHDHGVGHLFVVVDAEEADLETGPGLYRVKDANWRRDSMFWTSIYDDAVERIGPIPANADTEGYPCAEICDACRDKLITQDHHESAHV